MCLMVVHTLYMCCVCLPVCVDEVFWPCRNGMRGLAGMLLFWQAVEELKLVEYRQVEPAVRDRLAWTVYKTFLHEGAVQHLHKHPLEP